jgi:hypothetical protein
MGEMKKITVEVDAGALAAAQAFTGESIAETVRAALREFQHKQACRELLKLRGKVKFDYTIEELRAMDDDK